MVVKFRHSSGFRWWVLLQTLVRGRKRYGANYAQAKQPQWFLSVIYNGASGDFPQGSATANAGAPTRQSFPQNLCRT